MGVLGFREGSNGISSADVMNLYEGSIIINGEAVRDSICLKTKGNGV